MAAIRPGDPERSAAANSKNEPNDPPQAPRRRASEALAALFGLLGMVVAALFAPSAAVQPRPDRAFSLLGAPVKPLIAPIGRLIPPSPADPGQTALIPISDGGRSSPS